MNIVQIIDSKGKRRVGLVAGGQVVLLKKARPRSTSRGWR